MRFCLYDDRPQGEVGLRLALASLARHCPGTPITLYHPGLGAEFKNWLATQPDVTVETYRPDRLRGWDVKPSILLHALDGADERVVWVDSDILVLRDLRPFFVRLDADAVVVAQEPFNLPDQGTRNRAAVWGLVGGREFGFTFNGCVIAVTRRHEPLLRAWCAMLTRPDYQAAQERPFIERPFGMGSDQDALGALLGAKEWEKWPVSVLRAGRDVLHCGGLLMYGVRERIAGLPRCRPYFLHAIANKPWDVTPGGGRMFSTVMALNQEVSPYVTRARPYRDVLGTLPTDWLTRRTISGRILTGLGFGHDALRGLPLTVGFAFGKFLGLGRTPGDWRTLGVRAKERLRFLKPLWRGGRALSSHLPWRWLPITSRHFGPPKGLHGFVREYLARGGADIRDVSLEVEPATTIERAVPHSINEATLAHFRPAAKGRLLAREVHELHDVRFWGDYAGTIIGRDDRIIGELTRDIWGVSHHRIFSRWKLPVCRRLPGTTAILCAAEAETNYWHWTFDVLPRLDLFRRAGFGPDRIDHYVINHRSLGFQRETLADLGIPWDKVVCADASQHLELERALVSRSDEHMYGVAESACRFLNQRAAVVSTVEPARRLYVTRRNAKFRRVANEDQILPLLLARGFEVIDPGEWSVAEQRKRFRAASVVVGPHGAGLTNLVYCRADTRVVELFAGSFVDLSYWCFSGHCQLNYWALVEAGPTVVERRPSVVGLRDNITVDPSALTATLEAMGVGAP